MADRQLHHINVGFSHKKPNLDGRQARTRGRCWSSPRTKHPRTARYPAASQTSANQPKCSECCYDEMCISITKFWPHSETKHVCLIELHCFCKGNNLDCQFFSIGTNWTPLEVAAVKPFSRSYTCIEAASLKLRTTGKSLFYVCSPRLF